MKEVKNIEKQYIKFLEDNGESVEIETLLYKYLSSEVEHLVKGVKIHHVFIDRFEGDRILYKISR